jgi:ABC-type enterochelin transport system ATPase subunit
VQGVVVATSADQQDGAVYLAISGLDKAKLSSCLQAAVKDMADKTAKVSLKQDGNITQVSDGKDTAFIGWVGKDVIVVSLHAKDKPSLLKWMGGKGALAKSEVGKSIAKLNTAATMWGAGEASKEIQPGVTVKGGYGTVTFSKGNLDADVHAVMSNATQASTMATSTKKQLDEAKQGQLPRTIVTMLNAVSIAAANDEVILKGSFVEQDLLSVLALAAGGFGGP